MSDKSCNEPAPRRSATVLLIRDGVRAPEVLMLKRHAKTAFGAVHVFPGGVVDSCDANAHDFCDGLSADAARDLLGISDALEFYSAAVREVFEETGVLLAQRSGSNDRLRLTDSFADDSDRRRLIDGELAWERFLCDRNLKLSAQDLYYFAHWVTPASEPRRFSTRFFLATMRRGQRASHDGRELTDSCWKTAAEVLEAQRAGTMRLIYPTYRTLKDIAEFETIEDIVDWAIGRQLTGIARVLPAIVEVDGRDKVVLPGDPRYPGEELA